jgi:Mo-dependent nitrogenase C-terminus
MSVKQYTAKNHYLAVWINNIQQKDLKSLCFNNKQKIDLLAPVRKWLNNLEISNPIVAHRLCKSIPNQCPFERQIDIFGRTILRIPPLCKLNPLYNEVVGLRFRAICYLADVCGEDVSSYC